MFNADQRQKEADRQQSEQSKLAASFMHLDSDLEIEWAGRMREFEEECIREWEHLEDRHQVQQQELNVRCEPLRHLTPQP